MDAPPLSTVAFPTSEPSAPARPQPQARAPYLPFRRISLPTAPPSIHRESVASVSSFDSLPEDGSPPVPTVMRNVNATRKSRPLSIDGQKRGNRRSLKPDLHEVKRRQIIHEFYETERTYVDGLELIYSHFLTPIIASLETPQPLLDRSALTAIFSNFIDIWNLHRSFFSSLTSHLFPTPSSPSNTDAPLSPILLSHFPYLSLYTPFVTAFPSMISSLAGFITPENPSGHYNAAFAAFVKIQEEDPRCGSLKLRDWLLTIVQRCPRYLLLLKDLIDCTPSNNPEHGQLLAVHTLVSKITLSLNSSLHTHAQTLSLLALQKATPNLPFQLISPGRTLLKRGTLLQIERSEPPREREFLLFSDCLIWLASEESERGWMNLSGWGNGGGSGDSPRKRPLMIRTRSKSEAEIPSLGLRSRFGGGGLSPAKSRSVIPPPRRKTPSSAGLKRHASSGNAGEDKYTFKARAGLVDLDVIVTPPREAGEERRFEVLSPNGSFVIFADTEEERDEWCEAIRQAKTQLLMSLNITNPNSTLTSSSSTNHIRLSLQALPFAPEEKGKKKERRGWVEHWVPAIWIPDEKAETCMRCGRSFGWRRRRHHCRLCGRCVCALCSERTFFISDPNTGEASSKPARACNACYETVFPVIEPPGTEVYHDEAPFHSEINTNTLGSLSSLPFCISMPSLPLSSTPEALMAIDRDRRSEDDNDRLRVRSPPSRPRSYHQILEDFQDHEHSRFDLTSPVEEEGTTEDESLTTTDAASLASSKRHTVNLTEDLPIRKEDTARRNKRFSLPAVALQTTSVTTRSGQAVGGSAMGSKIHQTSRSKRFSLVLGHRGSHVHGSGYGSKSDLLQRVEGGNELAQGAAAGS
ncbi:hypothetical protein BDZ89DRAFT_1165968 [Hymenopellis radicata]|nr:hypothetical protein BDZ89DRAFT_1165968 [Hymenopellis radicata]